MPIHGPAVAPVVLTLAWIASVAWAAPAAARIHSLTGNARYQFGNGLPLPVGFTPAPDGAVQAVPGATVRVHPDPGNPSRVVLDPVQLSAPIGANVFAIASAVNVFQLQTAIGVRLPSNKASFRASGRTGAATVTFCAGNTITPVGNPACNPAGVIPGLMRYTRTTSQFGGVARANFGGQASLALNAGGASLPCSGCVALFLRITPPTMPVVGAPFGYATTRTNPALSPGAFNVNATGLGLITAVTPSGVAPGTPVTFTSHGGPWTTGMLTITNSAAIPPQVFVFSGSDGRVAGGIGSLSLVSGAMTRNSIGGPEARRGWLNLSIGPQISKTPAAPARAGLALLALITLTGAWMLRRRTAAPSPVPRRHP